MKRPINVKIDSNGTKYVTDTGRDQILVFDRDDKFVTAFGKAGEFRPVDVAIAGERLYVADIQHHEVQVLERSSGKFLFKFGGMGAAPGDLYFPTNMTIGENGDVYVVETNNFRVQRFTSEGKSIRVYGEVGVDHGNFSRPKGIAMDHEGRLFVGDAAFQNVQIFDNAGQLLLFFGQPTGDNEGLNLPAAVSIDYDNIAYFRQYAAPGFSIEYLIFVVSQFGPNKVDVYGFGKMAGMDYSDVAPPDSKIGAKADPKPEVKPDTKPDPKPVSKSDN